MRLLATFRHNLRSETGSNLVEFSLVFAIVSMMIFGLIDLSRVVYASTSLEAAAQAGARYGITAPYDTAGIEAAVTANLVGVDTSELQITVTHPDDQEVKVTLTYEYQFITPVMAQLSNAASLTLHASARMTS
ncbi:MAG: pilus assembly protein [Chloroflexi bacterium]|nr:pilus assembly protein [Chloroflexota bacterium]